MAESLALTNLDQIAITQIANGSVLVRGYISPIMEPQTRASALLYRNFETLVTGNTIAGMTIIDSNSTVNGGETGDVGTV